MELGRVPDPRAYAAVKGIRDVQLGEFQAPSRDLTREEIQAALARSGSPEGG